MTTQLLPDPSEEPWAEAAMWAYQFAGALTVAYDFKEGDIVPLLDVLSDLAQGIVPVVAWPAVVPSLGVAGVYIGELDDDGSTHDETVPA